MTAQELDELLVHAKEREEAVLFIPPDGWELVPNPPPDVPAMPYDLGEDELLNRGPDHGSL